MIKFLIASLTVATILWSTSAVTPVNECPGVLKPTEVTINDCTEQPCKLHKNKDSTLNVTFVAPEDLESLKAIIKAKVFGFNVNFKLPDDNACHGLDDITCPIPKNSTVHYTLKLPVYWYYPSVKVNVTFRLVDGNGKDVVCYNVDALISG